MNFITLNELKTTIVKIKFRETCSNFAIVVFDRQISIVIAQFSHSFVKCVAQIMHMKTLMIIKNMSIF